MDYGLEIKKKLVDDYAMNVSRNKEWFASELGSLFEKYVSKHERAVRLDAELGFYDDEYSFGREKRCLEAWKESEDLEKQLRAKLKQIVGIE